MSVNVKKYKDWSISSQAAKKLVEGSETSNSSLSMAIPVHMNDEITTSAGQLVECKVCNKLLKAITNSHLKKHNMTCDDYKRMFPDASLGDFSRFSSWRDSEENKQQLREQNRLIYSNEELREKRKKNLQKVMKTEEYKKNLSNSLREFYKTEQGLELKYKKVIVTDIMKMNNFDRWVMKYGYDEAIIRQKEWQQKNIMPSSSRNTKIERIIAEFLVKENIEFIQQYAVPHYYCDFFLPKFNLIIEANGDYWHANPTRFSSNDLIGPKKSQAHEIWARDLKKELDLRSLGYKVLILWESKIRKITAQQLIEDIVHAT